MRRRYSWPIAGKRDHGDRELEKMKYRLLIAATSVALGLFASLAVRAEEKVQAQPPKPDLAKAQQTVSQVCAACHGADGNSVSPANPSIAGQHADYLTLQLMHFQTGIRANAVMQAMVAKLTPEEMRALGIYFSQQKAKPSAAKDPQLVAAGQKIFRGGNAASGLPACAGCHSPDGAGIPARYPRVGGQYADYTLAQLKAFKAGERGADKEGKDVNGKVMAQVASRMSEGEMQAVAEFTSGLH
jgi:cytochrome c553